MIPGARYSVLHHRRNELIEETTVDSAAWLESYTFTYI
jgi:hypothetical protein